MIIEDLKQYVELDADAKKFMDYLIKELKWNDLVNHEDKDIRTAENITVIRMLGEKDYKKMLAMYWSIISGSGDNSNKHYKKLKEKGLKTFEDIIPGVRKTFPK